MSLMTDISEGNEVQDDFEVECLDRNAVIYASLGEPFKNPFMQLTMQRTLPTTRPSTLTVVRGVHA